MQTVELPTGLTVPVRSLKTQAMGSKQPERLQKETLLAECRDTRLHQFLELGTAEGTTATTDASQGGAGKLAGGRDPQSVADLGSSLRFSITMDGPCYLGENGKIKTSK